MENQIQISTTQLGKKYGSNRLFKNLDLNFRPSTNYCITGINGSGKSTLLLCLTKFITPTEGKVNWIDSKTSIEIDNPQAFMSFCSPALNLFEDLTLEEHLKFQHKFLPTFNISQAKNDLETFQLQNSIHKQISSFSSGMKQRLKLILAFNNDVPVLFLDEPCSNLDQNGISHYQDILKNRIKNKTIIIATNLAISEFPLDGTTINL